MNRFVKTQKDKYGEVIIFDMKNTESVCLIYAHNHPYAPDLILEALNKKFPETEMDIKSNN